MNKGSLLHALGQVAHSGVSCEVSMRNRILVAVKRTSSCFSVGYNA